MLEAEIWGIAETGDGYMIFIKPLDSEDTVPIFIGQLEAQAILIGFGGISISRPLTADLLKNLINKADLTLLRIEISEIKDNTFFGRLVLKNSSGKELILDSRPSDALALAVRCKSPIYIAEKIVQETGIPTEDLVNPDGTVYSTEIQGMQEKSGSASPGFMDTSSPLAQESKKRILKAELDEAVETENYERAAKIRDSLNLLEK